MTEQAVMDMNDLQDQYRVRKQAEDDFVAGKLDERQLGEIFAGVSSGLNRYVSPLSFSEFREDVRLVFGQCRAGSEVAYFGEVGRIARSYGLQPTFAVVPIRVNGHIGFATMMNDNLEEKLLSGEQIDVKGYLSALEAVNTTDPRLLN